MAVPDTVKTILALPAAERREWLAGGAVGRVRVLLVRVRRLAVILKTQPQS